MRPRRTGDDASLVEVERRAAELFRPWFPAVADAPFGTVETIQPLFADRTVSVVVGPENQPIGYSVTGALGRSLHLFELTVDPDHGRRGIGSALVEAAVAEAAAGGFREVSLTTFRDVPFNQPFYERLGFAELAVERASIELGRRLLAEVPEGVPVAGRVLMIRRAEGTVQP